MVVALAVMVTSGTIDIPTFILTWFETTLAIVAHNADELRIQITESPCASVVLVNVLLLVPTVNPLIRHWYVGVVPPLVVVAVNVTGIPEQMLELVAAILTVGVTEPVTLIVELALSLLALISVVEFGDAENALIANVPPVVKL